MTSSTPLFQDIRAAGSSFIDNVRAQCTRENSVKTVYRIAVVAIGITAVSMGMPLPLAIAAVFVLSPKAGIGALSAIALIVGTTALAQGLVFGSFPLCMLGASATFGGVMAFRKCKHLPACVNTYTLEKWVLEGVEDMADRLMKKKVAEDDSDNVG